MAIQCVMEVTSDSYILTRVPVVILVLLRYLEGSSGAFDGSTHRSNLWIMPQVLGLVTWLY